MKSTYDIQAEKFLEDFKIRFEVKDTFDSCPPWTGREPDKRSLNSCQKCGHVHGKEYLIRLSKGMNHDKQVKNEITFPFWGSYADAYGQSNTVYDRQRHKAIAPTAYSVLASISCDINCPDTFEAFCSEYGYGQDSQTAEKTFHRCLEFALQLNRFFTKDEIEALQEIQ